MSKECTPAGGRGEESREERGRREGKERGGGERRRREEEKREEGEQKKRREGQIWLQIYTLEVSMQPHSLKGW